MKNNKKSSKYILIGIIGILIILAFIFLGKDKNKYSRESIDNFAKCITEKGTLMYGTFWCPKCAKQKKIFGSSFKFINYVECDARGENEQSQLCIEKKVEKFPDWQFPDESRLVEVLSLENLATRTGCPVPQ
ncbi:hypothetical protein EXS72_02705 [Candidatus Pacearchaeota archaeon]|nr:hypothetical protein [Candidatus Pacearchaeota archaeon]